MKRLYLFLLYLSPCLYGITEISSFEGDSPSLSFVQKIGLSICVFAGLSIAMLYFIFLYGVQRQVEQAKQATEPLDLLVAALMLIMTAVFHEELFDLVVSLLTSHASK